jgi:hypothetical protein
VCVADKIGMLVMVVVCWFEKVKRVESVDKIQQPMIKWGFYIRFRCIRALSFSAFCRDQVVLGWNEVNRLTKISKLITGLFI